MQDLGPLAAAVAFAEVLRPAQVKMYKVRHQQQANGRLPTLNGTFEDTDDDWYEQNLAKGLLIQTDPSKALADAAWYKQLLAMCFPPYGSFGLTGCQS